MRPVPVAAPRLPLLLSLGLVLALAVSGCGARGVGVPVSRQLWLSGASGDGVADDSFGAWRGAPVTIAGTFNDNHASQVAQYTLQPGADLGAWSRSIDDAVGAIDESRGETWAAAATGAYDDRWRATLQTLAGIWADRSGTLYLRFAHEFNLDSSPWAVSAGEVTSFVSAWRRFRALQREILPAARLVFCPNSQTTSSTGLDWRRAFPGDDYVDVESVDYYNQFPYVSDAAGFDGQLDAVDGAGAPRGLEAHRAFAESHGLPFAISEWGSNADDGDAPGWIARWHSWLESHAGTGPGQVLYEIEFNVSDYADGLFSLHPTTRQPDAAAAYRDLWSQVS